MAAHAMINEVLVAFDPFNKLLKLKNAQEYGKLFYSSCKGSRKMDVERGGCRVCHINCTIHTYTIVYKQFFQPAPVAATVAAVLLLLLELGLI